MESHHQFGNCNLIIILWPYCWQSLCSNERNQNHLRLAPLPKDNAHSSSTSTDWTFWTNSQTHQCSDWRRDNLSTCSLIILKCFSTLSILPLISLKPFQSTSSRSQHSSIIDSPYNKQTKVLLMPSKAHSHLLCNSTTIHYNKSLLCIYPPH